MVSEHRRFGYGSHRPSLHRLFFARTCVFHTANDYCQHSDSNTRRWSNERPKSQFSKTTMGTTGGTTGSSSSRGKRFNYTSNFDYCFPDVNHTNPYGFSITFRTTVNILAPWLNESSLLRCIANQTWRPSKKQLQKWHAVLDPMKNEFSNLAEKATLDTRYSVGHGNPIGSGSTRTSKGWGPLL